MLCSERAVGFCCDHLLIRQHFTSMISDRKKTKAPKNIESGGINKISKADLK